MRVMLKLRFNCFKMLFLALKIKYFDCFYLIKKNLKISNK